MATSHAPAKLSQGDRTRLAKIAEEHTILPLIDRDEPWSRDEIPSDQPHVVIQNLQWANAVDIVDQRWAERDDGSKYRYNVYQFRDSHAEYIKQRNENMDQLPCGHKAHVHHRQDGGFGCKFCSETREFDRETVEEVMFDE